MTARRSLLKLYFCMYSFFFLLLISAYSQERPSIDPEDRINVFFQCPSCDMNYIRQHISYINYVRDQAGSDVHIMVNRQTNGSGGRSYIFDFMGRDAFEENNFQLTLNTNSNQTFDEIREEITRTIELGMIPYLAQTEWADRISVKVNERQAKKRTEKLENDPWNYWIFRTRMNGNIDLESQRKSFNYYANISASRVTEEERIRMNSYYRKINRVVKSGGETYESDRIYYGANASYVKSLGDHWSAGLFSGLSSNSYSNIKLSLYLKPAVEFNIFPYEEVTKKEFTIAYKVGPVQRQYFDETIFNKTEELLWDQSVELAFRLRQPWGSVLLGLEGAHFFHDLSKNRLEFDGDISFRVFKGLAVNMSSNLELVRNQLALRKGEASIEDILLQQTQLATNYEAYVGLGLSYTFGSLYNNIVNTRL